MKVKSWLCAAALGVGLLGAGQEASAESLTLNFAGIASTVGTADHAEAAGGLRVIVSDEGVGANQVKFTFLNVATANSNLTPVITDIYFQDGTLLGIAQIIDQPGGKRGYLTDYREIEDAGSQQSTNFPGGNSINPAFDPTVGINFFGLTPDGSPSKLGIGVGETLGVVFNLLNGLDFEDVRSALNTPPPSTSDRPSLRIGMHVQSIGSGDLSGSYINVPPGGTPPPPPPPPPAVPLPATVWAGLALMGGIGAKRLRRKTIQA